VVAWVEITVFASGNIGCVSSAPLEFEAEERE
jgi:hypothetical protein